jgi:dTDP-4-amino-4,6-dideoxygalactose transaminase
MIPFYRPYFNHAELIAALRPSGDREAFESAVATRLGARYGVAFAYARSGLVAALRVLGISQAEIVLPAFTCVVMAQAVLASGNTPVFVDIDLADYNMDLNCLRQALTSRTRAVIVTHMYGYPADVEAVRTLVGDERVLIIEDRAQKLLRSPGQILPFSGDVGLCSFGINKELCTVQGGVVVTNSPALYEKLRVYRDAEMDRRSAAVWAKRWLRLIANYVVFNKPVYGWLHRTGAVGLSHRLTAESAFQADKLMSDHATALMDFQGRIGLAQLAKLDTATSRRRALAELYARELRDVLGLVLPPLAPEASYAYFTLRVPQRDALHFRQRMLEKSVAVDETYEYALPTLKPYRAYAHATYPHAVEAAQQVINLPIYPQLGLSDAQYIARSVRDVLEGRRPEFSA